MNDTAPLVHPRLARRRIEHARDYLAHLELARQEKLKIDGNTKAIDAEIASTANLIKQLSGQAGQHIQSRKRVPMVRRTEHSAPRPEYLLFLDECGSHPINDRQTQFPVFCLCGVIVDADQYRCFDRKWKAWKASWLGSPHVRVHEPDVRKRSDCFHKVDPGEELALMNALSSELLSLDFTCVAAVIDKRRFAELHPTGVVDDFLPRSSYLMCLDFIIERFVHFLYYVGQDALGLVTAESRGVREDAEVHAEFIRLQLHGTQWQSESWFRYQLRPFIEFQGKHRNNSGLQIADLAARPIAEKVLNPKTMPERWEVIKSKLYDGGVGRPESYGLKLYPAHESLDAFFERTTKAEGDAIASPSAD